MKLSWQKVMKGLVAAIFLLFILSSLFPTLAIRRYVFLKLQPINSFQIHIENMNRYDPAYGHLYNVTGYVDRQTQDEIGVFYLKKYGLLWTVSSAGTGP